MATRIAANGRKRIVVRSMPRSDSADRLEAGYAVLAVGTYVVFSTTLLSPGIESLTTHFEQAKTSIASADLLAKMSITMPAVVVALIAPFGGWLLDRLGRRGVLLAGVIIYGLAGSAGGVLSHPLAIIGSRIVFGLGVAAILLASTTLIGDYFDGKRRRQMLGWQVAAVSVVSTVGMFLAAWLVSYSWRWPFALYLTILLLLPWTWKTIDEPTDEEIADDDTHDDAGSRSIQWHAIGLIYVASFLALAIFHLATTQVPGYLDELGHGSPYMTATIVSLISLISVPSSVLFNTARKRFSNQMLLVGVFVAGAVGFFIAGIYQSIWTLVAGLAIFGTLYGLRTPSFNAWLLNVAPAKYRGRLVGGLTSATFLGIFASPLLSNPLKAAVGMPAVILVASGLQVAFAAAFIYLAVIRKRDQPAMSD